ncbi:MAG: ATP synthase F1 subunit epsilon [Pirellulaceae bacterium]
MAQLNCIVVTPEQTALDQKAEAVVLPLYDGEIGILPGHSPMIGRLGFGEMRIRVDGQDRRYYVDGGFAQVANDVVSVLTNRAVPADRVDEKAAQEQLNAALRRPIATPELLDVRDRLIDQARAQIRVARHR